MNNKKIYDFLIKILLKKAEGYYYTEEQEDYEKTQIKSSLYKKPYENLSMFDNIKLDNINDNTYINVLNTSDKKKETDEDSKNMVLVKKKITKHYIPPDMLAIKILFETVKEKIDENLENLSDEELLKLKEKLIGEILNENK